MSGLPVWDQVAIVVMSGLGYLVVMIVLVLGICWIIRARDTQVPRPVMDDQDWDDLQAMLSKGSE